RNESFCLESIESRVNAAEQDVTSTGLFQLSRDRDAVRLFADAEDSQQHHHLEVADRLTTHLINLIEQMHGRSKNSREQWAIKADAGGSPAAAPPRVASRAAHARAADDPRAVWRVCPALITPRSSGSSLMNVSPSSSSSVG